MDQVDSSRPTCGSGTRSEDYNLPLHIGALFIILGVSASACAFPLVALKVPQLHVSPEFLFFVRHFGTGVLIATAFVHLFPTAFVSLTDRCLPSFWTEDYPAMTGAIALAAVFAITIIEMLFSPERSSCSYQVAKNAVHDTLPIISRASVIRNPLLAGDDINPACNSPLNGGTPSGKSHNHCVLAAQESAFNNELETTGPDHESRLRGRSNDDIPASSKGIDSEQRRKKLTMQCLLLEMGILFHSVFIGMALAVSVGSEQVILLIAIAFHQTFEGLALGSRIAAVGWRPKAPQPWFMALAYGCTTPLGQAVGIATHNLYDPDSETGLLVVGIMNAISSGLLTFTSLVDLLSEDFLSDDSWRNLRGRRRIIAFLLVFGGAFGMSLIGAWA
ncbi:MAG: hypothetical protein Q9197_002455 [Variospora fuerteventurae]